jgi:catechol 2,3-dioxygenase-like lactoylglutathione lyase family enzyme
MTSSDQTTVGPAADDVPQGVGRLASVSLDCGDPSALADFYGALLGMRRVFETPDGGLVALSDGTLAVTMMRTTDHVAPTWPDPGQQQQLHLDVSVIDLDQAVAEALRLGATEASHQPAPDTWRVLLDPAGHPFCLTTVTPD